MSSLVAIFQIGSLGDAIVSLPTLLSIPELIPDCSEYLLINRFDSKANVLPGEVFEMAWKPKLQINYSTAGSPLTRFYNVAALLAKLRYYKPRYCIGLMPAEREAERLERDMRFFKAGGVKEILGFQSLPIPPTDPGSYADPESTEAFFRFQRLWGAAASEKFRKYSRVPVISPSPEASRATANWLEKNRAHPQKRLIAISPYSNFPSRDIPAHAIAAVVPELARLADAEIIVVGGSKDRDRAAKMLETAGGLNGCGLFSVQESAALLKSCALAICTESGPMHLAAAIGVPLLVTFSRINQQFSRWLPFAQHSTILYREVPCAGCFSRNCPVAGHPCMENISAEEIIWAAMNILNGAPVLESSLHGTRVLHW